MTRTLSRIALASWLLALPAAAAEPPTEWVEPATGHRVVRLSREPGTSSLYFHQNAYTAAGSPAAQTARASRGGPGRTAAGQARYLAAEALDDAPGRPSARTAAAYYRGADRPDATVVRGRDRVIKDRPQPGRNAPTGTPPRRAIRRPTGSLHAERAACVSADKASRRGPRGGGWSVMPPLSRRHPLEVSSGRKRLRRGDHPGRDF